MVICGKIDLNQEKGTSQPNEEDGAFAADW